ncbi:tetratricopeptide repeat protein [Pilimelia terevasa]|uniref:tetratricopeptide repeat protein n=1 Tax=Pilimelia terevasa TaxID=53372 RepID=UPI00166942A5|nr:tetratricopeptide repeat protein [Pilimelia terevasa]
MGNAPAPVAARQERAADGRLWDAVAAGGAAVVAGLGGVGKTQVAAALAHRLWAGGALDLLVWVSATSARAVRAGYALAAADVTGVEDEDDRDGADRFLNWLQAPGQAGLRWLVVLDDVGDPADLAGWWPPVRAGGATVVTSRRRDHDLTDGRALVDVEAFTPAQAVDFLTARLRGDARRLVDAGPMAADLGFLPLALDQAAGYIGNRGIDCRAYRRRFAQRALDELAPTGVDPAGRLANGQHPVAVTWRLSVEAADDLDPVGLALPLLRVAALLDGSGIPRAVLTSAPLLRYLAAQAGREVDGDDPAAAGRWAEDAADAVENLRLLSLLTVDATGPAGRRPDGERPGGPDIAGDVVRVHALVQRATREAARRDLPGAQTWRQLVHAAADAVLAAADRAGRDPRAQEILRGNARTLIAHGGGDLWVPDGHRLLYGLGGSLRESGRVAAAADYFRELADTAARYLGPDHPDTHLARGKYARCLDAAGRHAPAAAEYDRLAPHRRGAPGDDDQKLVAQANRATAIGSAGDPKAALRIFTGLVRSRTRLHGPHDPRTLVTRANQARWRGETGDQVGALRAYDELVPLFERTFGPSEQTLWVYGQQATWRGELDPAAGVADLARLLPAQSALLGAHDPSTLLTRHNLAGLKGRAGKVDEAVGDLADLVADCERHLAEPDHPVTLMARSSLAQYLLLDRGDGPGAYRVLRDLVNGQTRALGADAPATARTAKVLTRIEDEYRRRLTAWVGARTGPGPHHTTVARLASDIRADADLTRRALTRLVDTGKLRLARGGQAGAVDPSALTDHARFQVVAA